MKINNQPKNIKYIVLIISILVIIIIPLLFILSKNNLTKKAAEKQDVGYAKTEQDNEAEKAEKFWYCGGYSCSCSDDYFYYPSTVDEEAEPIAPKLEQYDFDGNLVNSFPMKLSVPYKHPSCTVALVRGGMIYLSVNDWDEHGNTSLWGIPLVRDEKGEAPDMTQAGQILPVAGNNESIMPYFIGDTVIACSSDGSYQEYDRNTGKKIPVDQFDGQNYSVTEPIDPPVCQYFSNGEMCGKYILLKQEVREGEDDSRYDYATGLYIHEIGSRRVTKLREHDYSKYAPNPIAAFGEEACFYTCDVKNKSSNEFDVGYDIMSYDYATGEISCFLPWKKLGNWFAGLHLLPAGEHPDYDDFTIVNLYIYDNRLYIDAYISYDCDSRLSIWSSAALDTGSLRYEKKLTKLCKNLSVDLMDLAFQSKICIDAGADSLYEEPPTFYDLLNGKKTKPKKQTKDFFMWEGSVLWKNMTGRLV